MGKEMNKKILIGSIIAVAVLVGVSFTSVVGYNTVKSTSGEASPLFNVRAKRAINQEDDGLTCYYVGKDQGDLLFIPSRIIKNVLLFIAIDIFCEMDDVTFNKLIELFKSRQNHNHKNDNILIVLNHLRNNLEKIRLLNNYKDKNMDDILSIDSSCTKVTPFPILYWIVQVTQHFLDLIIIFCVAISVMLGCELPSLGCWPY